MHDTPAATAAPTTTLAERAERALYWRRKRDQEELEKIEKERRAGSRRRLRQLLDQVLELDTAGEIPDDAIELQEGTADGLHAYYPHVTIDGLHFRMVPGDDDFLQLLRSCEECGRPVDTEGYVNSLAALGEILEAPALHPGACAFNHTEAAR